MLPFSKVWCLLMLQIGKRLDTDTILILNPLFGRLIVSDFFFFHMSEDSQAWEHYTDATVGHTPQEVKILYRG